MRLRWVPLTVSLVPLVAIHLCYVLAAQHGHVPWCLPYIDSCTSISATGRHSPESLVFRAAIMPSAALMLVYWVLVERWLRALHQDMVVARHAMLGFGLVGALGLLAYAAVLGEVGDAYRLQRRLGVTLFFACTILAQLLMTRSAGALARSRPAALSVGTARILLAVSAATVLLSVASLLGWAFVERYGRIEDAVAWWLTLLVLAHPLVTFFAWRQSGFDARVTVARPPR